MNKIVEFAKSKERAIKTFIEAFCSYIAVNIAMTDFNSGTAIKGLLIGAVASALSLAINSIKKKEE